MFIEMLQLMPMESSYVWHAVLGGLGSVSAVSDPPRYTSHRTFHWSLDVPFF